MNNLLAYCYKCEAVNEVSELFKWFNCAQCSALNFVLRVKAMFVLAFLVFLLALPLAAQTTTTIPISAYVFNGCGSLACLNQPEQNGSLDISNPSTGVTIKFVGRWSGVGISTQTLNLNNGKFFIETPGTGRVSGRESMTGYRVLGMVKIVNEYNDNPHSPLDLTRLGIYTEQPILIQNIATLQTVYSLTLKDMRSGVMVAPTFGQVTTYNLTSTGSNGVATIQTPDLSKLLHPREMLKLFTALVTMPQRTATSRR